MRASQIGNEEYNPAFLEKTFQVKKLILTVTADDQARNVNAYNPLLTFSYRGFFGDDSLDDLDTLPVASTDAEEGSPTGPYTITLSGGSDDNYDFQYVNGKLLVSDLKDQTINFSELADASLRIINLELLPHQDYQLNLP